MIAKRAIFLLPLVLASCLQGLDATTPGEQRVAVDVWSWNIAAGSLMALVPEFEEQHPGIEIRIDMTGADMQSRFLLSLIAGVGAPDISQLQLVDAPKFAPSGALMDLTDKAQQYADKFSPSFWDNCTHEGRVYAIPWDMGPCAVFYKRDLFKRYDIELDAIETWEDYITVGKRIVKASEGETRMLTLSVINLFQFFEMLMQQTGGGVFDRDGRIIIHSPENVQALEVLRAILDADIVAAINVFTPEFFASFQNDTIATYPLAVWLGGSIKDYAEPTAGNWGVFRLPAVEPGGLRTSNLGGSVLVIPNQSEKKEEAWKYVEYALCTEKAQIEQYRNFDLFPCLMTTFDDPFFDEPDPFYGGQKVRRLFTQDIEKIPTLTRTKDWNEAMRYITQMLSAWETEKMDHEVFLSKLAVKLERKLSRPIAPGHEPIEGG
ncbi:MAG: sugar ABC transporter substrate-binding protein [Candidatus Hydrogenedentes bacterium]|nr:sugar ABC transporter substrate-binding protein [Candidatus Hydrogenedentota bacterium]